MQTVNRLEPALSVTDYQTYSITAPPDTAHRSACEEANCQAWRFGWESTIDESTELGRQQATYIRQQSGRTFREMRADAGMTVFRFEPGQRCFAEHGTRPEIYVVRDGDWRGNPTGRRRQHTRAQDWVEDFGEHQLRLVEQKQKG